MARDKQLRMSICFPDASAETYRLLKAAIEDAASVGQTTTSQVAIDILGHALSPRTERARGFYAAMLYSPEAMRGAFARLFADIPCLAPAGRMRACGRMAAEALLQASSSLELEIDLSAERSADALKCLAALSSIASKSPSARADAAVGALARMFGEAVGAQGGRTIPVAEVCRFVLAFWDELGDGRLGLVALELVAKASVGWERGFDGEGKPDPGREAAQLRLALMRKIDSLDDDGFDDSGEHARPA